MSSYNQLKTMCPNSFLEIDLSIIKQNYLKLRELTSSEIAASIKANSYGLGATHVTKLLRSVGVNKFFASSLQEALELREQFKDIRIFVLSGVFKGEEEFFLRNDIIPVINNLYQIELFNIYMKGRGIRHPIMIHIETGMHRLSMPKNEVERLLANPELFSSLDLLCIMSHLASSEDENDEMNKIQLSRFNSIITEFKKAGYKNILVSLANSGGILLGKAYHFDIVRSGAALYGINGPNKDRIFRNPVRLFCKLIQFKEVKKGEAVGYNSTYRLDSDRIIGTIVAGYGDGIFRNFGNRGCCFVKGFRAPIVGRVSMDLINIDLSSVPPNLIAIGQEVDIISQHQSPDDLADIAGTIGYEILTSLGNRYERIYKTS